MGLRFPGQYQDTETGLVYNAFRDYAPDLGRYIEPDPTGLVAGMNMYAYVNGNPLIGFDPYGLADYRDQCIGRYAMCAVSQDPNASTFKNWVMFKGCKATVDAGTEKAPSRPVGVAIACQADFHDCTGGRDYGDPTSDPRDPTIYQCNADYVQCVAKGKK